MNPSPHLSAGIALVNSEVRRRLVLPSLLVAAFLAGCGKPDAPAAAGEAPSAPAAAPAPAAPPAVSAAGGVVAGWGSVVDPIGDAGIQAAGDTLKVTVPAGIRDLSGVRDEGGSTAPRILQDVEGDFVVSVKVTGDFNPPARPAANAFHGAGILVFDTDNHYLRVERNIWTMPDGGQANYAPLFEYWVKGQMRSQERSVPAPFFKGRSTWLRLERSGKELKASIGTDGSTWEETNQVTTDFPAKVKVGICAINTAAVPLKVEFSDWKISKGK